MEAIIQTLITRKTGPYLFTGDIYHWIRLRRLVYQHNYTSFFRSTPHTGRGNVGQFRKKQQATNSQRDSVKESQGQGVLNLSKTVLNTNQMFALDFEEQFVYPHKLFRLHAIVWLRFIDDCFMLRHGTPAELDVFLVSLNQFHRDIQFTSSISTSSVNFLDVQISKHDGFLRTDLYTKPTDSNSMLHVNSFHSTKQISSIPYSQFLLVRRTVNDESIINERLTDFSQKFLDKGYNTRLIRKAKCKALHISREELLSTPHRPKHDRISFQRNVMMLHTMGVSADVITHRPTETGSD
ncbi:Hypothetical predicted protein [Pelobates cultripes]|uniref:Helix-turn-helix domain-containing protein n=1 Tax=Pelobates cultripes TaxID=61616 RepID=A0AAD1RDE8_PELCU|nr:Hypothetical predicted protein [Pelobates cultripes]